MCGMKLVAVKSGLTMLVSLVFMCLFGEKFAVLIGVAGALGLVLSLLIRHFRKAKIFSVIFAVLVFAACLYSGYYYLDYLPAVNNCTKESAEYSGTCVSLPESNYENIYYIVKVDTVNSNSVKPFDVRLRSSDDLSVIPGDRLTFSSELYELGTGSTMSRMNYMSKRTYVGAYSKDVSISSDGVKSVRTFCLNIQLKIIDSLRRNIGGDNSGVIIAMLFGSRSYMSDEARNNVTNSGLSHLLCVSGLHLSIWCLGILKLLRFLKVKPKVYYPITILAVIGFMTFTGFTSSVVRAGVMLIIYLVGEIISREKHSLTSLCIAGSVVLLNPFNAMSVGFLLSFTSTLGIITIATPMSAKLRYLLLPKQKENSPLRKLVFYFANILIVSFSALVGTLPVTVTVFGKIVFISLVANIVVIPISSALMVSGLLAGILGLIVFPCSDIAFYPVNFVATHLSEFMLYASKLFANFKYGRINSENVYIIIWLVVSLVFVIITFVFIRKSALLKKICVISVSLAFLTACLTAHLNINGKCYIRALGVSNGYSLVIAYKGEAVMVDCGGTYNTDSEISSTFERLGVTRMNTLLLTGNSLRYTGSLNYVLKNYDVDTLVETPEMNSVALANDSRCRVLNNTGTYTAKLWDIGDIYYFAEKNYGTVMIDIEGTRILVDYHGVDVSTLPSVFSSYDYVICSSLKNNSLLNKRLSGIIVCGSDKNSLSVRNTLFSNYEDGSAQILSVGEKSSLRRVGKWES